MVRTRGVSRIAANGDACRVFFGDVLAVEGRDRERDPRGYWRPDAQMRALGFQICPGAVLTAGSMGALAAEWNKRWQTVRKGEAPHFSGR